MFVQESCNKEATPAILFQVSHLSSSRMPLKPHLRGPESPIFLATGSSKRLGTSEKSDLMKTLSIHHQSLESSDLRLRENYGAYLPSHSNPKSLESLESATFGVSDALPTVHPGFGVWGLGLRV